MLISSPSRRIQRDTFYLLVLMVALIALAALVSVWITFVFATIMLIVYLCFVVVWAVLDAEQLRAWTREMAQRRAHAETLMRAFIEAKAALSTALQARGGNLSFLGQEDEAALKRVLERLCGMPVRTVIRFSVRHLTADRADADSERARDPSQLCRQAADGLRKRLVPLERWLKAPHRVREPAAYCYFKMFDHLYATDLGAWKQGHPILHDAVRVRRRLQIMAEARATHGYQEACGALLVLWPWLSRCIPLGPLKDRPDTFVITTA